MTSGDRQAVSGRAARSHAAQAGYRPGVAQVRLVGPRKPSMLRSVSWPTFAATPGRRRPASRDVRGRGPPAVRHSDRPGAPITDPSTPQDRTALRIGVTGSRRYGSPAVIHSAFLAAHDRARPHDGHVLVHGQCDPYHPDTNRPISWRRAKDGSVEEQGQLLGGDWLAEWVALGMAKWDGITWQIDGTRPTGGLPGSSNGVPDSRGTGHGEARRGRMGGVCPTLPRPPLLPAGLARLPRHGALRRPLQGGNPGVPVGPDGYDPGLCGSLVIPGPIDVDWPDRGAAGNGP